MISPVSNTAEHLSQRAKANASCAAYAAGIIKYSRDGEHSRDAATEEIQEQRLRNISAPSRDCGSTSFLTRAESRQQTELTKCEVGLLCLLAQPFMKKQTFFAVSAPSLCALDAGAVMKLDIYD